MKKILTAALSVLLLFSLCACDSLEKISAIELPELPHIEPAATPELSQQPPENSTGKAESDQLSPADAPEARIIVNIAETVQEFYDPAEGKELILDFSYETPHVDISGRDAAADAINEFVAGVDEAYCTGNDYGSGSGYGLNMMLEMATDTFTYAYNSGNWINFLMSSNRTVRVKRSDSCVLSLLYKTSIYTGGAHGSFTYRAYSFDTQTGELITLDKLITDKPTFEAVALAKMKAVVAEDPDWYFEPSDEQLLALIREGSWYLGESGVVIFPELYEIASFVAGVTFFEIPYEELNGSIDGRRSPKPHAYTGELTLIEQKDFQNGSMEVIDKLTADAEGEELCLVADGTVYDVEVLRVSYTDYSRSFMETAQLWQSSYMDNCAVQLQTRIPEGMPDLMVGWRTAEGEEVRRLVTRGESGNAVFVSDTISAVG